MHIPQAMRGMGSPSEGGNMLMSNDDVVSWWYPHMRLSLQNGVSGKHCESDNVTNRGLLLVDLFTAYYYIYRNNPVF